MRRNWLPLLTSNSRVRLRGSYAYACSIPFHLQHFRIAGCAICSKKEPCMHRFRVFAVLSGVLLLASLSQAQTATGETLMLDLPRASQHAQVMQRIGITDITLNYHRPLANGRQIWGKVVPYGQVWRAGANENTTITFSDPVTIEGQALEKGTYGLHMIPGQEQWTIILSKNATSWGSFTYKQDEDALRVNVKPQVVEMHDALAYDFDDVKPDSAVITMRWEKVAVPFKVHVNVNDLVTASIHRQMHGLNQYYWEGWDDAAGYFLANKINLDEALKDEDLSIQAEERYDNLMNKSKILDAMGKKQDAEALRAKALDKANALQLYIYGRQLQGDKKQEEALAIYRSNAKKFPDYWTSHLGLARVYSAQGDFDNAVKELKLSMPGAPDANKNALEGYVKRLQAKDDINR